MMARKSAETRRRRRAVVEPRLVAWVRQAAPYIHAFRGRAFVIAFGGDMLASDAAHALIHDIALLDSMGVRLVLVHGARPQIDAEMRSRGLEPRFHNGLRVTDGEALDCVKRAMGVARIDIEALLSQGLPNTPLAGAFLRVTGGNYISAKPVGVVDGVDFNFTGAVRKVEASEICADLDQENVVLITPIAASPSGEVFNLAWEEVAEAVAVAINAEKLIFLCDSDGLVDEHGELIEELTVDAADRLLSRQVVQAPETTRVLPAAVSACRNGVGRVHFLHNQLDGAMLMELFTHSGVGTIMTRSQLACLREANGDDVGAVLNLIAPLEADGVLVRRERERLEMEIDRFTLLEHDGVVIACAALYPLARVSGEKAMAELACMAVAIEHRRAGYGDMLLRHIEKRARAAKIRRLCVLTTRTAHWFVERGFVEAAPSELPQSRRELYNYQRRSKVLLKNL